jgi:hypothetical protein
MPKTSIDPDALARETLDAMPTLDVTEQRRRQRRNQWLRT